MRIIFMFFLVSVFAMGCTQMQKANRPVSSQLSYLSFSDIKWEKLNPARGDKSPLAGVLWGGLKSTVSSGFLVKFTKGFSSPPHIHNVSYRGIVIKGLVHNDDPKAENMWMPPGSFWTQPKGESHITSAKSQNNVAYIEIDNGPYLVRPSDQSFDSGERPVNVDPSNIVWIKRGKISQAYLWGSPHENSLHGTLVKFPLGYKGEIFAERLKLDIVVVKGDPQIGLEGLQSRVKIEPGSYISLKNNQRLQVLSSQNTETVFYIRTKGMYSVK